MNISIDIGTSHSSIFYLDASGESVPVNVRTGMSMHGSDFSLPSAIYVDKENNVLVGQAAMNSRKMDPSRFRAEFKRALGQDIPFRLGERDMLPEDMYTEVFRHLKSCTEKAAGEKVEKAFITYPASFSESQKQKVEGAAHAAGLFDVALTDEPTAAAMCYCAEGKIEEGETLLVYDFGGGTFDAALIRYENGAFTSLETPVGLPHCGGIDIDRLIYADMLKTVNSSLEESGMKQNKMAMMRFQADLAELAVKAKHHLTSASSFSDGISVGYDYLPYTLTLEQLNGLISGLVQQTIDCCRQLLDNAGLSVSDLNRILLVGGTSRVPLVEQMVHQFAKGVPVLTNVNPELAVAQGALCVIKTKQPEMPIAKEVEQPEERQDAVANLVDTLDAIKNKTSEANDQPKPSEQKTSAIAPSGASALSEAEAAAATVSDVWLEYPMEDAMQHVQNDLYHCVADNLSLDGLHQYSRLIAGTDLHGRLYVSLDDPLSDILTLRTEVSANGETHTHQVLSDNVYSIMSYLADMINADTLLKSMQVLCEEAGLYTMPSVAKQSKAAPDQPPSKAPSAPVQAIRPKGSYYDPAVALRIGSTSYIDFAVTPNGKVVRTSPAKLYFGTPGTSVKHLFNIAEICCVHFDGENVLLRKKDGSLVTQDMMHIEKPNSEKLEALLASHPRTEWAACTQFTIHQNELFGIKPDGSMLCSHPQNPLARKIKGWSNIRQLYFGPNDAAVALTNSGHVLTDGTWDQLPCFISAGDIVQLAVPIAASQKPLVNGFVALHADGTLTCHGDFEKSYAQRLCSEKAVASISYFVNANLLLLYHNGTFAELSSYNVLTTKLEKCVAYAVSRNLNFVAVDHKGFSYAWGCFPKRKNEVASWPTLI